MNEITETRNNGKEHKHTLHPYWHNTKRLHMSYRLMPVDDTWFPVPRRYVAENERRGYQ